MGNKKFDLKSMVMGVVVGAGLFGGVVGASTLVAGNVYLSPFPIIANGKSYTATSPILNYNGSTYVPLKELATLTDTEVSFKDRTIYIENKEETSTVTKPVYLTSSLEMDEGDKKTIPVNLNSYGATKASISISNSYIKVSQSLFTASGNLTVTGQEEGKSTVTIKYNTGDTEYITVTVNGTDEEEEDIEVEVDKYENVYIDLDDYDADKATISITSGSSYITLNKTTFTSSGNLKITGKKEGNATIRIKFDSVDTEYLYIEVTDEEANYDDYDYEDEFYLDVDEYDYIYVDLEYYDADEADLAIIEGTSYVSLGKTKVTSSKDVKITGKKEGDAIIEVEYDTGDVEYFWIEVTGDDDDEEADYDDYDYEDEIYLDVDEYEYIYVDLGYYDADEADLRIIAGKSYITLGKTNVTSSREVKVTGDEEGEAIIEVEYDTGDVEYYWIEVME